MKTIISIITAIATAFLLQSCKKAPEKYVYFSGNVDTLWDGQCAIYLEYHHEGDTLNKIPYNGTDTIIIKISSHYNYRSGKHRLVLPEGVTTLIAYDEDSWKSMDIKYPKTMRRIIFLGSLKTYDTTEIKKLDEDNLYSSNHYNSNNYTEQLDSTESIVRNGYKYEIAHWGRNGYNTRDSITLIVENIKEKFVVPVAYDTTENWYGYWGQRCEITHTFIHKIRIGKGVKYLIVPDTITGREQYYDGEILETVPPITIISDSSDVETLILGSNCRIEGSFPKLKRIDGGSYTYEQYKHLIKLRE